MIRAGLRPLQAAGQCPHTPHRAVRVLAAVLLATTAWAANAQAVEPEAAVMKRAASLREQAGDSARSVAELAVDAPVTRTGERQGPWIRVRNAQGATGWVHLFDVGTPSAAAGPGLASGALRSVTGFFSRSPDPRTTTATSTIGIRGLGAEDIAQAQPDLGGVSRMEALRQGELQARQFARDSALRPVQVESLPAPPRNDAATAPGGVAP
jgi:hypothetical protein